MEPCPIKAGDTVVVWPLDMTAPCWPGKVITDGVAHDSDLWPIVEDDFGMKWRVNPDICGIAPTRVYQSPNFIRQLGNC
jgi:hypothetical protein